MYRTGGVRAGLVEYQATRAGGKVVLVGMGTPIQTLPLGAAALRKADLGGICRYANAYPRALEIMEVIRSGKDKAISDVRKMITHSFQGLETAPDAFGLA